MRELNDQTDQIDQELYLISGQVARRLGLFKRTVLRAMHRGESAPAYQTPGGYFRFRAVDVDAYTRRLRFETGARDDA